MSLPSLHILWRILLHLICIALLPTDVQLHRNQEVDVESHEKARDESSNKHTEIIKKKH